MTTQKIKNHYDNDTRLSLLEQSLNCTDNILAHLEKQVDQLDNKINAANYKRKRLWFLSGLILLGSALGVTIIKFIINYKTYYFS